MAKNIFSPFLHASKESSAKRQRWLVFTQLSLCVILVKNNKSSKGVEKEKTY